MNLIWGAGNFGKFALQNLNNKGVKIDGFVDSDMNKWNKTINQIKIFSPDIIKIKKIKKVFIASMYWKQILEQLRCLNFPKESIEILEYNSYIPFSKEEIDTFEDYLEKFFSDESFSYDHLKQLEDDFWLYLHLNSSRIPVNPNIKIPPLPSQQIQTRLTGVSGAQTLLHGFRQYELIKEILTKHHFNLNSSKKVLDFGVGFGRILRFFLREVDKSNLFGTDINEDFISWLQNKANFANFLTNNEHPPIDFPKEYFDLIFAFSVFSHLSERSGKEWLSELNRITRKGALVILTIWAHPSKTKDYHYGQNKHFPNYEELTSRYDNGEFCYSNELYNNSSTYGEALIPEKYIFNNWSKYFDVIDIIKNHSFSPNQYYVVLKK